MTTGAAAVLGIASLSLAGCGVGVQESAATVQTAAFNVAGRVHGGVFPIDGATITLMATTSNGYGAAASVLATTTSDQNGDFTFSYPSKGWNCPANQFAYITVTSGYTINLGTTQDNNNVVQVGVIGSCSDLSSTEAPKVNVFVSELSTVAAAYALGNFISITDASPGDGLQVVNISAPANNNSATPGCTGTGRALVCTAAGLAHGFQNAVTLVDSVRYDGSFPSGKAQFSNALNSVSGVPAQLINTIGNILQSCVDSIAGASCGALFTKTTPPSGTAPKNTLQAAMNMAKYPTNNIADLFKLQPQYEFFTPDLATAPTSFTVSIFYGVTLSGSVVPYPVDIATDSSDNIYVLYGSAGGANASGAPYNTYGAVYGLSAAGKTLYKTPSQNTSILYPTQIVTDASGHLFVSNNDTRTESNGALFMANTSDGVLKQVVTQDNASGLAVDRYNNVWASVANVTDDSVYEYTAANMSTSYGTSGTQYASAPSSFFSGKATYAVTGLAIDGNQNIWGVSGGSAKSIALVLPNTNASSTATPAPAPAYGSQGSAGYVQQLATSGGFGMTLNSSGEAFFPLASQLDTATYTASSNAFIVNPPSGHGITTTGSGAPQRSATDGAGNMFWADLESNGLIYEYNPTTAALSSFLPCYPIPEGSGYSCITTTYTGAYSLYTPSNLRAMAIDSSGDIWYAADAGYGAVIETLGVATPVWPQLSYGQPGVAPQ